MPAVFVSSATVADALSMPPAHADLLVDTVAALSVLPGTSGGAHTASPANPTAGAAAAGGGPRCSLHELCLLLVAQLFAKETARHYEADDPWPELAGAPPSPGRLGCNETLPGLGGLAGPASPTKMMRLASPGARARPMLPGRLFAPFLPQDHLCPL